MLITKEPWAEWAYGDWEVGEGATMRSETWALDSKHKEWEVRNLIFVPGQLDE